MLYLYFDITKVLFQLGHGGNTIQHPAEQSFPDAQSSYHTMCCKENIENLPN